MIKYAYARKSGVCIGTGDCSYCDSISIIRCHKETILDCKKTIALERIKILHIKKCKS